MKNNFWITPELIVLTRSNPEEAVLGFCKKDDNIMGPTFEVSACRTKVYDDDESAGICSFDGYCLDYANS